MECPSSPSAAREMTGKALLAVKREHLLAPVIGRCLLGCDVGRPVAHHLLALAFTSRARRPVGAPALVCVCVRETSKTISRWPMTLARWPFFRELEVDVVWFPLVARNGACPVSTDPCVGMSHLSVVEVTPGRSSRMR